MSILTMLLIAWAGLTTVLIVLLIYRGTLTMHEEDQLFLDDAEKQMQEEQEEIHRKVARLSPFVRVLGAASALLIVAAGTLWIYEGLNRVQ